MTRFICYSGEPNDAYDRVTRHTFEVDTIIEAVMAFYNEEEEFPDVVVSENHRYGIIENLEKKVTRLEAENAALNVKIQEEKGKEDRSLKYLEQIYHTARTGMANAGKLSRLE